MPLRHEVALQVGLIVLLDAGGTILQVCKVGVIAKEGLDRSAIKAISGTIIAQCLGRPEIGEECIDVCIIIN